MQVTSVSERQPSSAWKPRLPPDILGRMGVGSLLKLLRAGSAGDLSSAAFSYVAFPQNRRRRRASSNAPEHPLCCSELQLLGASSQRAQRPSDAFCKIPSVVYRGLEDDAHPCTPQLYTMVSASPLSAPVPPVVASAQKVGAPAPLVATLPIFCVLSIPSPMQACSARLNPA